MQFLNILALAAVAVAIPAPVSPVAVSALEQRQTAICSGLGGTPLCCATDVLGLVVLDCYNREWTCQTLSTMLTSFSSHGSNRHCFIRCHLRRQRPAGPMLHSAYRKWRRSQPMNPADNVDSLAKHCSAASQLAPQANKLEASSVD
jgi:hypothetical protein